MAITLGIQSDGSTQTVTFILSCAISPLIKFDPSKPGFQEIPLFFPKKFLYMEEFPLALFICVPHFVGQFMIVFQFSSWFPFSHSLSDKYFTNEGISLPLSIYKNFLELSSGILSWLKSTKFPFDDHRPEHIIFFLFLLLVIFFTSLTRFLFLAIFPIFHIHLIVNSTHARWISKNFFRPCLFQCPLAYKTVFICCSKSLRHFAMVEDYGISYRQRPNNRYFLLSFSLNFSTLSSYLWPDLFARSLSIISPTWELYTDLVYIEEFLEALFSLPSAY